MINWSNWLLNHRKKLQELGLPEIVIQDEEHWEDFFSNAALHYHPGYKNFFRADSYNQTKNLRDFLLSTIDKEEKIGSGLLQQLNEELERTQGDRFYEIFHKETNDVIYHCKSSNFKMAVYNAISENIELSYADLSYKNLTEMDFSNGKFDFADFSYSNLTKSNLENSSCIDTDFSCTNLTDVIFSSSNLERASFIFSLLFNAKLNNTNLKDAIFENSHINETDFSESKDLRYENYSPLKILLRQKNELTGYPHIHTGIIDEIDILNHTANDLIGNIVVSDSPITDPTINLTLPTNEILKKHSNQVTLNQIQIFPLEYLLNHYNANIYECEFYKEDISTIPYSHNKSLLLYKCKIVNKYHAEN